MFKLFSVEIQRAGIPFGLSYAFRYKVIGVYIHCHHALNCGCTEFKAAFNAFVSHYFPFILNLNAILESAAPKLPQQLHYFPDAPQLQSF